MSIEFVHFYLVYYGICTIYKTVFPKISQSSCAKRELSKFMDHTIAIKYKAPEVFRLRELFLSAAVDFQ